MKTANEQGARRRSRSLLAWGAASSVLVLGACTGSIGPVGVSGSGSGSGTTSSSGSSGTMNAPLAGQDPGTVPIHRLNALEYDNTTNELLGLSQNLARTSFLPDQTGVFDNEAGAFTITDPEFSQYFGAAKVLSGQVFADAKLADKILNGCADNSCLQNVITNFGLRAYRRPLTPEEITRSVNLAAYAVAQGADFSTSVKQVVRMMLSSIPFLYRVELDPNPMDTKPHPVGDYEMASRLSYLLWSSMPDAALFADAAAGKLAAADTTALVAQVERMLADPKSSNFISSFAGQWLRVRELGSHQVEPTAFKSWSEPIRNAMTQEEFLYFNEFVVGNLPWTQFLTAPVNFVNGPLAALYGAKNISATQATTTKVTNMDPNRVGFMGLAGFLTETSFSYRTTPTMRGKRVLVNLLCEGIPDPPPNVAKLDPPGTAPTDVMAQSENVAVRLAQHRDPIKHPDCFGCHRRLDPVGLGLENFDGIGAYRTKYGDGTTIDPAGVLPDGSSFTSVAELAKLLSTGDPTATDPAKGGRLQELTSCASRQLLNYALSRPLLTSATVAAPAVPTDDPYVAQVQDSWAKDGTWSIKALLRAIVLNDTFRFRHGGI
jgi:Protein of unknown function (DUF1592)/Protein of unknown function (DUF1588)/Protein of unknown function (DUF1595)/Protein of unknown function (DUF1587)